MGYFLCLSLASFWDISMNFLVPTLLRYAKSPALVKTLFCPYAGSNWFTNKSHGNSSQSPQCSTLPVAQACSLHSPQKGCPFWLPHPEQLGFSFLFKKVHVPQYVPHGATSFSLKHPASAAKDSSSTIILFWFRQEFCLKTDLKSSARYFCVQASFLSASSNGESRLCSIRLQP